MAGIDRDRLLAGRFSEGYMDDDRSAIRLITRIFEADPIGPA